MLNFKKILCGLGALLVAALPLFAQSSRPGWGATPYADSGGTGVTFRTWAPNASSVAVAGSFNSWNMTSLPLSSEGGGVWSRDVASARTGMPYKIVINGSLWRRDPYGRQMEPDGTRNSLIVNPSSFAWGTNTFAMPPANELVVYEMHVGAFYDAAPADGQPGHFSHAAEKLDYLKDLGVNAIELMPVAEFPSATSWGYNLSYPFTVEATYGSPADLKALVKACHDRGIAVLMDVVHNHWGDDSNDWSLWQYDGWNSNGYGGIFFFNDSTNCCTPWGPRPDFSRAEVQDYILDNFRMWKGEYRIDGFRWDAPKYILFTDDTQTTPVPNASNAVDLVLTTLAGEYPGTLNIAEDIKGVAGFDSHWDLGFLATLQTIATESDDNNRSMYNLASAIIGDSGRIVFTESHDSTGDLNGGSRLPKAIDGGSPESYWARKRSTLAAAIALTSPGTPMIWMGQEMLETNSFSDSRTLDWSRTNSFANVNRFYRDLLHLRRNWDGVSAGLSGSGSGIFLLDNTAKMIGWRRYDPLQPDQDVVIVANFRNTVRTNYAIPFPAAGTWYVHLNSDNTAYGPDYSGVGDTQIIATGNNPASTTINMGPYSVLILSKVPRSSLLAELPALVDQPLGNNNGTPDPGETLHLPLAVTNRGQVSALNISAELLDPPEGVTVLQGSTAIPDLAAGLQATGGTPLVVRLSTNWPCGQLLTLDLRLNFNGGAVTQALNWLVGTPFVGGITTNSFGSTNVPQSILDHQTTYSQVFVTNTELGALSRIVPWVRLNHTWDSDLVLALQHPDGTEVILSNHRGSSGDNFGSGECGVDVAYTVFDSDVTNAIRHGSAPFVGTYQPDGSLTNLVGKSAAGAWRLRVTDSATQDEGTLLCWGLTLVAAENGYTCAVFTDSDSDGDGLPDWWEEQYFGGATNAVVGLDDDGDGFDNLREFRAGTNPQDAQDYLKMQVDAASAQNGGGFIIRWSSKSDHTYRLMRSTSLLDEPFAPVHSNIPATPLLNSYTDETPGAAGAFYRVEVE